MVRSQQERTTEVVHSEFPEHLNHGQQLLAGGAIVSISFRVFLTEVCHNPLLAPLLFRQYSARGQVLRIHVQDESTVVDGQREDRRDHQSLAPSLEGFFAGPSPDELLALMGQIVQGNCERREVRDELPIPGAQADKATELLQVVRYWPNGDRLNLGWVHTDGSFRHHMEEEMHLPLKQPELLHLQLQRGKP